MPVPHDLLPQEEYNADALSDMRGWQRPGLIAIGVLILTAPLGVATTATLNLRRKAITSPAVRALRGVLDGHQHIYIVRHGDKYSSYKPPCPGAGGMKGGKLCFDPELMGDNPPLTDCGIHQANLAANWLQDHGEIKNIAVSPYTRTLQTALPLAKMLKLKLQVEYLLSEANQDEGPYREFNINALGATVEQLEEIKLRWDRAYGSPPIKTPENNTLYVDRVKEAVEVLKEHFPPKSGNLAIFSHATTTFSLAYGLCHGDEDCDCSADAIMKKGCGGGAADVNGDISCQLAQSQCITRCGDNAILYHDDTPKERKSQDSEDDKLEKFVKHQDAIAPAGFIEVILNADGSCVEIKQTNNDVSEVADCGETEASKCEFDDYPSWYWACSKGMGPGKCH